MSEFILAEKPFISIQGEGKTINKISYFIRFYGCNLRCDWCDSKFSYNNSEETFKISIENLIEDIIKSDVYNIIFTGGEPLLYQNLIFEVVKRLEMRDFPHNSYLDKYSYEIETNGSVEISKEFLFNISLIKDKETRLLLNISPKLKYSKEDNILKYNINKFKSVNIPYILKFVDEDDIRLEIMSFISNYCKKSNVYIMPECSSRIEHIEKFQSTLDFCRENGYNFSPRLHLLLWDKKRGV